MAKLKIAAPGTEYDGREFDLANLESCVIGRAEGCSLLLAGKEISRRHAEILRRGDKHLLQDLGSSHGTYLAGKRVVDPVELGDGDRIGVGPIVLTFVSGAAPAQPAAAPKPAAAPVPAAAQPAAGPSAPRPAAAAAEDPFAHLRVLYRDDTMRLKKQIHEQILMKLNLSEVAARELQDSELHTKVEGVMDAVIRSLQHELPRDIDRAALREALLDDVVGYGPIGPLLRDDSISEVMVNSSALVFFERAGRIYDSGCRFFDDRHVMRVIQRIVEPLGRRIDEASPMVDARLPDGSRVNAIIPPLALDGPAITIRKFAKEKLTIEDVVRYGSVTPEMGEFLNESVRARQNILISGGTGSGKTTLLNILSLFIPLGERIVTIEDSAELKLHHKNLVRLESRPPNVEGRGRVAIRDLVINSLRMRPDRIIVGECRGAEALDMLQAMNTGHEGSLTTIHANSPRDALMRLENMVLMAGIELPSRAIREQITSGINLVVQQSRLVDGSRKVTQISEITGREGDTIMMQDIFTYEQKGFTEAGKVVGVFHATGNVPFFIEQLKRKKDLRVSLDVFKPRTAAQGESTSSARPA